MGPRHTLSLFLVTASILVAISLFTNHWAGGKMPSLGEQGQSEIVHFSGSRIVWAGSGQVESNYGLRSFSECRGDSCKSYKLDVAPTNLRKVFRKASVHSPSIRMSDAGGDAESWPLWGMLTFVLGLVTLSLWLVVAVFYWQGHEKLASVGKIGMFAATILLIAGALFVFKRPFRVIPQAQFGLYCFLLGGIFGMVACGAAFRKPRPKKVGLDAFESSDEVQP